MRAVVFQHTCVRGSSRGSIEPRTMEQSQVAPVELEWGWQSPKASSKPTVAAFGSRMQQRAVARASRLPYRSVMRNRLTEIAWMWEALSHPKRAIKRAERDGD